MKTHDERGRKEITMTAFIGIHCDTCDFMITTTQTSRPFAQVRNDLTTHAGWVHNRVLNKDYCPSCVKKKADEKRGEKK